MFAKRTRFLFYKSNYIFKKAPKLSLIIKFSLSSNVTNKILYLALQIMKNVYAHVSFLNKPETSKIMHHHNLKTASLAKI